MPSLRQPHDKVLTTRNFILNNSLQHVCRSLVAGTAGGVKLQRAFERRRLRVRRDAFADDGVHKVLCALEIKICVPSDSVQSEHRTKVEVIASLRSTSPGTHVFEFYIVQRASILPSWNSLQFPFAVTLTLDAIASRDFWLANGGKHLHIIRLIVRSYVHLNDALSYHFA